MINPEVSGIGEKTMILQLIKDSGSIRWTLILMIMALIAEGGIITYGMMNSDDATQVMVLAEPESNATLQLRSAVMAVGEGDTVEQISLAVSLADGAEPVNFTMTPDSDEDGFLGDEANAIHPVTVSYMDGQQQATDIAWRVDQYGPGDGDVLLEEGETFRIVVGADVAGNDGLLTQALDPALGAATPFTLRIATPDGEILDVERSTPEVISPVMNLY